MILQTQELQKKKKNLNLEILKIATQALLELWTASITGSIWEILKFYETPKICH